MYVQRRTLQLFYVYNHFLYTAYDERVVFSENIIRFERPYLLPFSAGINQALLYRKLQKIIFFFQTVLPSNVCTY